MITLSIPDYFNFINNKLPVDNSGVEDPTAAIYQHVTLVGEQVKDIIVGCIGQLDREVVTKQFFGDATPVLQFHTQTVTAVSQVFFTLDGFTWKEMPIESIWFDYDNARLVRNPLYEDDPNYGTYNGTTITDYKPYDPDDPKSVFPSPSVESPFGNIKVTYEVGWDVWEPTVPAVPGETVLPEWIKRGWLQSTREITLQNTALPTIMPASSGRIEYGRGFARDEFAFDQSKVENVVRRRFGKFTSGAMT